MRWWEAEGAAPRIRPEPGEIREGLGEATDGFPLPSISLRSVSGASPLKSWVLRVVGP